MTLGPTSILLDGRRALVTGGARGIGRATAVALARFGADVALVDRLGDELVETVGLIRELGREVPFLVADVRDTDVMGRWIGELSERWSALHVLVNNAGGGFVSRVRDVSPGGQAALIAENFTQVLDNTRLCIPLLSAGAAGVGHPGPGTGQPGGAVEGGSSIVNITSIEAHRAGPGFGVYSAMKAAVANLTRTLALELADDRIRVNAIAPDMIPTPGDAGLSADSGALGDSGTPPTPWPETGAADDVAAAVVWLAGPMSRFVTGSTVHVDGGTFASSGWRRGDADGQWVL